MTLLLILLLIIIYLMIGLGVVWLYYRFNLDYSRPLHNGFETVITLFWPGTVIATIIIYSIKIVVDFIQWVASFTGNPITKVADHGYKKYLNRKNDSSARQTGHS